MRAKFVVDSNSAFKVNPGQISFINVTWNVIDLINASGDVIVITFPTVLDAFNFFNQLSVEKQCKEVC